MKDNILRPLQQGVDAVSDRLESFVEGRKDHTAEENAGVELPMPDLEKGLSSEQVEERKALGLVNRSDDSGIRTTGQIIRTHTLTWFNILNLFLGFLIFLTGDYKNMLFLGVAFCNTMIGIIQELRVRNLIRNLNVVTQAKATVLRDGEQSEIPIDEVVRDEIIDVKTGDQIVADGPVLSAWSLEVNEAMLTGEAKPVRKNIGDKLLSGSFVVAGEGRMQAENVGRSCFAGKVITQTHKRHRASSEMLNTIRKIIRTVSIPIIPIGILLYFSQRSAAIQTAAANGLDSSYVFRHSIIFTVSGVIGMIPEGLVLLTSVSFIIGVGRLALKRALVQEMEAIEALARTDILCTDKTGTITTGELKVSRIVSVGDVSAERIRSIMARMGGALPGSGNTETALEQCFGRKFDWTVTDRIPFSSERKYKAASFAEYGAYVLGAPEYLAPGRRNVLDYVKKYSDQGYRCLLLCSSDGISSETGEIGNLTPMSVLVLSDIIRSDAREMFERFAKSGVCVKVLSGDHPATVSAVADAAGIEGAKNYLDARTLPEDPAQFAEAIRGCNIFGRVLPEQKQAFVRAWQEEGHTVAMVGDGVNDVLALKDADCGIAMAAGSEAARHAAHIVLLDSEFSSLQDIIGEGRTIICNIERVSALYLTKTIYSTILCLIFIFLRTTYPWTTLQMGLINLVGIGMPSFLLALERHEDWKGRGFLVHVLRISLPAALTMVTTVLLVQLCNFLFGWSGDMYSFFSVMLGGIVSLLVVRQVCDPLNIYRGVVWGLCIAVFLAAIIFLSDFYDIHSLWTPWSLLLIPLAAFIGIALYGFGKLVRAVSDRREKRVVSSVQKS